MFIVNFNSYARWNSSTCLTWFNAFGQNLILNLGIFVENCSSHDLKFCANINKILKMAPYSSSVEFLSVFERAVNINQDGFLSTRAWDEILPNLIFVRFLCFMIGRLFPSLACHSLHDVSSYSAKYFQS